ncbi:MAG: hypothetical protein ABI981_06715 [Betaproteobacteria bacterium]
MTTPPSAETQRVALLAEKIRSIPDKLVSMQIDLRPLCTDGVNDMPAAAKRKVAAACEVLQSAIGDLQTVLEYVGDWEAADRRNGSAAWRGDGAAGAPPLRAPKP